LVRYPLDRLAGWRFAFVAAEPDEARDGSTWLRDRRIAVYVRPNWTPEETANVFAHELGHAHDAVFFSPRQRDRYLRLRGLGWWQRYVTVKWPSFSATEPRRRQRVGCEDFAEVFARRWGPRAEFQSSVRAEPDDLQLQLLEPFLAPQEGASELPLRARGSGITRSSEQL
jgi:hypothetical protein